MLYYIYYSGFKSQAELLECNSHSLDKCQYRLFLTDRSLMYRCPDLCVNVQVGQGWIELKSSHCCSEPIRPHYSAAWMNKIDQHFDGAYRKIQFSKYKSVVAISNKHKCRSRFYDSGYIDARERIGVTMILVISLVAR
jgi:hypothetical protein